MRKERCPECAKLGKDTSHDNLIVYSDGHKHCFACGFHVHLPGSKKLQQRIEGSSIQPTEISYPADVTQEISEKAISWIRQYGITTYELSRHGCLWSEYWQRLIFPIKRNGTLIGWVGRAFGTGPKWYIKGKIKEGLSYYGKPDTKIILCEDIVSAIKLSRHGYTAPLFGAFVSRKTLLELKSNGITTVILWLDPDKQREMLEFGTTASALGLESFPIFSEKDPKEHDDDFLKKVINECSQS